MTRIHIALVGDSDIDRWPPTLVPNYGEAGFTHSVHGLCGATLGQVVPLVKQQLLQHYHGDDNGDDEPCSSTRTTTATMTTTKTPPMFTFLVVCAGENDLSEGIALSDSAQALQDIVDAVLLLLVGHDYNNSFAPPCSDPASPPKGKGTAAAITRLSPCRPKISLIFLGPKLEPWLQHDKQARREYIRLSERFERTLVQSLSTSQEAQDCISYINCLTMFRGDSGQCPGATWGGKAVAQSKYFHSDQLHLSDLGYQIWKQIVEECISKHLEQIRS